MNPLARFWPQRGRRPDPALPRLDEAAAERLVMTALEGMAAGWTAAQLQAHLGPYGNDHAFESWLANFAYRRWFPDPAAHQDVALGLVRWGELDGGALGKAVGAIGLALLQSESSSTPTPGIGSPPSSAPSTQKLNSPSELSSSNLSLPLEGDESIGEALLQQSIQAFQDGDIPEALTAIENATRVAPHNHSLWLAKTQLMWVLKRYEEMIAVCDQVLAIKPDSSAAYGNKGNALYELGQYEAAIAAYDQALNLDPPNISQGHYVKGNSLKALMRYEEAMESYEKAIAIKPDYPDAHNNKGNTLAALDRHEEALSAYDKALVSQPNYLPAYVNKGVALTKLGRFEEALIVYDQALNLKPDYPEVYNTKGNILENLGCYEEAIFAYDQALALMPNYPEAFSNKGIVLHKSGQYREAIDAFDQAILFKPDYFEAFLGKGNVLLSLKYYDNAIVAYDQAISIKPDSHVAYSNKGVALQEIGLYKQAVIAFDQALSLNPAYREAYANKGLALQGLERFEEAISVYDQALSLNPTYPAAHGNKGTAFKVLGRYEEAIMSFDYVLSCQPDDPKAWLNRGTAAGLSWQCSIPVKFTLPPALQDPRLDLRGYDGAIACLQAGLQQISHIANPQGWGQLHHQMGVAHFFHYRFTEQAHRYAHLALTEYAQALTTLTPTAYPEEHLQVLQDSIRAHLLLGQNAQAHQQRDDSLALLRDLINRHPRRRQQLEQQFSGLSRIEVDLLLQEGSPITALEAAERYKNRALTWLLDALGETTLSPSLEQITTLLRPTTALVMWHLSPDALTRFLLRPGHTDPIATSQSTQGLETWLKTWDRDYADYRSKGKTSGDPSRRQHPWRKELSSRLERLADILDIPSLIAALAEANINHLILIPHGDLHRLPLHTCFGDSYTSHTLPSAQLGLTLQARSPQSQNPALLSIEDPTSTLDHALSNAALESALIRHLCQTQQRPITTLAHAAATRAAVIAALHQPHGILHYTGHGLHNPRQPRQSALALATSPAPPKGHGPPDQLTAADLAPLPLTPYGLVTLAACETAITGQQGLTEDYVGLPSSLMQAGVAQIVSTLWVVEEATAAWLMVNFYQRWLGGEPAATALHQAQQWLRTQTHGQLAAWLRDLAALPDLDPQLGDNLRAKANGLARSGDTIQPEVCPYSDPYYWAAFVLTGSTPP